MSTEAIALAFSAHLPYVGLRDHEHDPDLDDVVPATAARTARALPLAVDEHHVRLAVATPSTDLTALGPYLEGRRVELAIAAREELDEILGPAPAPEPPADPSGNEEGVLDTAGSPGAEVPSWVRRRRVEVTLLVVLLLLVLAAAAVAAAVATR